MGRARIDAAGAASTAISAKWLVRFEWEIEQKFCQEKIGSQCWMDQTGVLSNPTKPCPLCKLAFEKRACIGVDSILKRFSGLLLHLCDELTQPLDEEAVVILPLRVRSDLEIRRDIMHSRIA